MGRLFTSFRQMQEEVEEDRLIRDYLLGWLEGYLIDDDDVDWLVREIKRYPMMFHVFKNNVRAEYRIVNKMIFAKEGFGNFACEITGRRRRGKSTFARTLVEIRENVQGEERVRIFDTAYSNMSAKVEEICKGIREQLLEEGFEEWSREYKKAFKREVSRYTFFFDERKREHEKGSRKAVNDIKNLINVTANTGCDWILVSPEDEAVFSTDCHIHILGYNKETKETLGLYYDVYNVCQGYCLLPQSIETVEYEDAKDEGMISILLTGGRKRAVVKELEGKMEEVQRFYGDMELREAMERELEKLGMPESAGYFIFYFFDSFEGTKKDKPDYRKTAKFFGKNYKTVYSCINNVLEAWGRVERGAFFEKYLEEKFSFLLRERESKNESEKSIEVSTPLPVSPLSVRRDGRQGFPDLVLEYGDGRRVPVNAKLHVWSDNTDSVPRKELEPEIAYGLENGTSPEIVYYNLYWHWDAPKRFKLNTAEPWKNFTVTRKGEGYLDGVRVEEIPLFDGLEEGGYVSKREILEEEVLEVEVSK